MRLPWKNGEQFPVLKGTTRRPALGEFVRLTGCYLADVGEKSREEGRLSLRRLAGPDERSLDCGSMGQGGGRVSTSLCVEPSTAHAHPHAMRSPTSLIATRSTTGRRISGGLPGWKTTTTGASTKPRCPEKRTILRKSMRTRFGKSAASIGVDARAIPAIRTNWPNASALTPDTSEILLIARRGSTSNNGIEERRRLVGRTKGLFA